MAEVVIYTRDFCYYSDAARELLTRKGVAFREINASGSRELRQEMIERANGGTTFPQIFIGATFVTVHGNGAQSFTASFPLTATYTQFITATATGPSTCSTARSL